jgi:CTP:molybdopterin cytidylyltransferase MocA
MLPLAVVVAAGEEVEVEAVGEGVVVAAGAAKAAGVVAPLAVAGVLVATAEVTAAGILEAIAAGAQAVWRAGGVAVTQASGLPRVAITTVMSTPSVVEEATIAATGAGATIGWFAPNY